MEERPRQLYEVLYLGDAPMAKTNVPPRARSARLNQSLSYGCREWSQRGEVYSGYYCLWRMGDSASAHICSIPSLSGARKAVPILGMGYLARISVRPLAVPNLATRLPFLSRRIATKFAPQILLDAGQDSSYHENCE